jgi:hypothetical protein
MSIVLTVIVALDLGLLIPLTVSAIVAVPLIVMIAFARRKVDSPWWRRPTSPPVRRRPGTVGRSQRRV